MKTFLRDRSRCAPYPFVDLDRLRVRVERWRARELARLVERLTEETAPATVAARNQQYLALRDCVALFERVLSRVALDIERLENLTRTVEEYEVDTRHVLQSENSLFDTLARCGEVPVQGVRVAPDENLVCPVCGQTFRFRVVVIQEVRVRTFSIR